MELQISDSSSEIALRNESINKQRLQGRGGGGPLKITDPTAFAKLMEDMKLKAEQQQETERQRELERARREGSAYKSKEERDKEAKAAKQQQAQGETADEAKHVDGTTSKFDPNRDYYALLEVDRSASTAEIKKAYKRWALLYHPDKHKGEGEEQQAAIADRFRQVSDAFDVLIDEERRALYDKIMDYKQTNPGKGLPPLNSEEAAMMRSGIAELVRLRRQGPKLGKHPPLEREVWVSLQKLNSGCTKSITIDRRRLDYAGFPIVLPKTFHLVIRKASKSGQKLVFEGEGEETVDSEAGDMIFMLRAKPHPVFKRNGLKDLEMFAAAVPAGDIHFYVQVVTLMDKEGREPRLVYGSALTAALMNGGKGGEWATVLPGQGLFDPDNPWEQPPGDLTVKLRFPPVLLVERTISTCLKPKPVYLVGSSSTSNDNEGVIAAALAGGLLAAGLRHEAEAHQMMKDEEEEEEESSAAPVMKIVCLSISVGGALVNKDSSNKSESESSAQESCSPAMQALVQVLEKKVPGAIVHYAALIPGQSFLDESWCALCNAEIILLELVAIPPDTTTTTVTTVTPLAAAEPQSPLHAHQELHLVTAMDLFRNSGVCEVVWKKFWRGCQIVSLGDACAVLGCHRQLPFNNSTNLKYENVQLYSLPILPFYHLRLGGGIHGWSSVQSAMKEDIMHSSNNTPSLTSTSSSTWVGVMEGTVATVNPFTGQSELIVAPTRTRLIDTGKWTASSSIAQGEWLEGVNVDEADDDYGYFAAWTLKA